MVLTFLAVLAFFAAAAALSEILEKTMSEEPFCVCGHDESEHGRKVCWGQVGNDPWCTCAGYREGKRSKELR